MEYELIQIPSLPELQRMSRSDLKRAFESFVAQIPHRLTLLESVVRGAHGFSSWHADLSKDSLPRLGEWFASHVEIRLRSDAEKEAIAARAPYPIEIPNEELTDRTCSFAVDVGIYFAETLRKHHPNLVWTMVVKDKRYVDYGNPLLMGTSPTPLNPVRILANVAYGVASKQFDGSRLSELYNIWELRL